MFTRDVEDLSEPPYTRVELWEMDLESFAARRLRDFRWFTSASYRPDGARILVHAGPAEFGGVGLDVPAGSIPNGYEGELFVWDPESGDVEPITKDSIRP